MYLCYFVFVSVCEYVYVYVSMSVLRPRVKDSDLEKGETKNGEVGNGVSIRGQTGLRPSLLFSFDTVEFGYKKALETRKNAFLYPRFFYPSIRLYETFA